MIPSVSVLVRTVDSVEGAILTMEKGRVKLSCSTASLAGVGRVTADDSRGDLAVRDLEV